MTPYDYGFATKCAIHFYDGSRTTLAWRGHMPLEEAKTRLPPLSDIQTAVISHLINSQARDKYYIWDGLGRMTDGEPAWCQTDAT